jgi:hypothetical protein
LSGRLLEDFIFLSHYFVFPEKFIVEALLDWILEEKKKLRTIS